MNNYCPTPSEATLKEIRETYPAGTRVELVRMNDPYIKLRPGDRGVVLFVDDIGSIHVQWDSGSTLAALYCVDVVSKLT